MDFLRNAFLVILSFFMLVSNALTAFIPGIVQESKSEAELSCLADVFEDIPLA